MLIALLLSSAHNSATYKATLSICYTPQVPPVRENMIYLRRYQIHLSGSIEVILEKEGGIFINGPDTVQLTY